MTRRAQTAAGSQETHNFNAGTAVAWFTVLSAMVGIISSGATVKANIENRQAVTEKETADLKADVSEIKLQTREQRDWMQKMDERTEWMRKWMERRDK